MSKNNEEIYLIDCMTIKILVAKDFNPQRYELSFN